MNLSTCGGDKIAYGGHSVPHDAFDIAKFVLSVAVVAIHTRLGGPWEISPLYPWLRLAVPLFFMVSAYLFFKKYDTADGTGKRLRLRRFAARNGQLYMFWLALLLVPTLLVRHRWFEPGILPGVGRFALGLLFGSTFPASWYITASVTAVAAIALATRRLPTAVVAVIAVVGYAFACLASNYGNLALWGGRSVAEALGDLPPMGNPYNNFLVALLWVLLGRAAARHESCLSRLYVDRRPALVALLVLGLALLCVEQYFIRRFGTACANDCYLSLPIPAFALFVLILGSKARCDRGEEMRGVSTITYCFHATLAAFVTKGAELAGLSDWGVAEFAIVLAASWALSWLILRLEKRPGFSVLRYSH